MSYKENIYNKKSEHSMIIVTKKLSLIFETAF